MENVNEVIKWINNYLKVFNNKTNKINNAIEPIINNRYVNYLNERTLAFEATKSIEDYFLKNEEQYFQIITELSIKNDFIKTSKMSNIEDQIQDLNKSYFEIKHGWFIPDAVAIANKTAVFIEYKLDRPSWYKNLAIDYLKYKYYTADSSIKSSFVYIVFKQSHGLPYLSEEIQMLSRTISRKSVSKSASLYISDNSINEYSNNINLKEININKISDLNNEIDEIKSSYSSDTRIVKFDNLPMYGRIKKITKGEGVLFANIIKDSFYLIKELRESIDKRYLLNPSDSCFNIKNDGLFKLNWLKMKPEFIPSNELDNCIDDMSDHFNKQIIMKSAEKYQTINKSEFNVSLRRALWIILVLQKYSDDNHFNIDFIGPMELGEVRLAETEELETTLDEMYKSDYSIPSYNKLALQLIYFISSLYDEIGYLEGDTFTFNNEYKKYKARGKLKENVKEIISLLGKKPKNMGILFSEEDMDNEIVDAIFELLSN